MLHEFSTVVLPLGVQLFCEFITTTSGLYRKTEEMHFVVNGSTEQLPDLALTIAELLKISGVESPDMVSVQLNGEFIDRQDYGNKPVTDGDEVDFLYFMGGGRA